MTFFENKNQVTKDNKSNVKTDVRQQIKCLQCGKKTVQQNPIEEYGDSQYCKYCDIMWKIIKKSGGCFFG